MSVPIIFKKKMDYPPWSCWADEVTGGRVHCSLPNQGHERMEGADSDPDVAFRLGKDIVRRYEQGSFPGGMGHCIGVARLEDGRFAPVVSTYYSPS